MTPTPESLFKLGVTLIVLAVILGVTAAVMVSKAFGLFVACMLLITAGVLALLAGE